MPDMADSGIFYIPGALETDGASPWINYDFCRLGVPPEEIQRFLDRLASRSSFAPWWAAERMQNSMRHDFFSSLPDGGVAVCAPMKPWTGMR